MHRGPNIGRGWRSSMDELLRMLTFEVMEELCMLEMFHPKLSAYKKHWNVKLTIVQNLAII